MFIVWGTRVSKKKLGRFADFCPICRKLQPFRATQFESYSHLYYIPIGRRKPLGYTKACEVCSLAFRASPSEVEGLSRDRHDDLESLLTQTNPDVVAKAKVRLEWEKRLKERKLTAEERSLLIREPFELLDSWIEERGDVIEKDTASGLGCLATILLPLGILLLAEMLGGVQRETFQTTAMVVAGIFAIATFYLMATTAKRYSRRVLIPRLARTLEPLNPSLEELETTVQDLKQRGLRIGKRVDPHILMEALHTPQFD